VTDYLLARDESEAQRLQLQARVWESSGVRLLAEVGDGTGLRALDVGCGGLGWLRVLQQWVGDIGAVIGTDVDESLLDMARALIADNGFTNVGVFVDDVFASALPPRSFDLVHARFLLAPLGRHDEQLEAHLRLLRPGGVLVLEEPDSASWRLHPDAPASAELIELIRQAFRLAGGDLDAGRALPSVLGAADLVPRLRAEVVPLPPDHPYLELPLQLADSLAPKLAELTSAEELDALCDAVADELDTPGRWGTTFTLIQAWTTV
jgi:SAM-dependent methyltransferase